MDLGLRGVLLWEQHTSRGYTHYTVSFFLSSSCSLYLLRAAIELSAGSNEELFQKENDIKKLYYVDYITVHPEYRRRGIASKLVSFSLEVNKI